MKSRHHWLIILPVLTLILGGCQFSNATISGNLQQNPEGQLKEKQIISASLIDPLIQPSWTLLSESMIDLDADNKIENISLHTAAQRDSKGEIMWDDGQKWLLLVKDEDNYYPLFSEYVQIGSVYFTIAEAEKSSFPRVTVLVSSGSNLTLTVYTYNQEKQGYEKDLVYDSKAVNNIYSSIPAYR